MNDYLESHSERVKYLRHSFLRIARGVRSLDELMAGRILVWGDLGQIKNQKVRQEAQDIFRNTMSVAEAVEKGSPGILSEVLTDGVSRLIAYLEANDTGEPDLNDIVEV